MAVSGSNVLLPEQDPPSRSQFPHKRDSSRLDLDHSAKREPRTVLLVEDNPTDIYVIHDVIKESGLDVRLRIARDGQDALQYFDELAKTENAACPAVVLLDLNLPKVSGVEVLRRFRDAPVCKQTPVIILTSSTAEADREAVQSLGAAAYFKKPHTLAGYLQLAPLIQAALASPEDSTDS